jgi:hypothetical protein
MKETFPGWYAKTAEELKILWEQAIIVPDTNVLLHLIRHSAKVRGQLMEVFERKKDALWIPYQVGMEFQRRRFDVQQQTLDAYDRLTDEMNTLANQTRNRLNQYRAHPVIEVEREIASLTLYFTDFEIRMAESKTRHPSDELAASFDRVSELFVGRVGAKPSQERLAAIRKEGAERYTKKIPPGFEDTKKNAEGADKYGDLIIWKEMIEKVTAEKRPLIFVTDDGKSDWWYIHHGKKVGPHPELVEEFLAATGQQFHIYEMLQFLRHAAESGSSIQADTVQQIADSITADSEVAHMQNAEAERARGLSAIRTELRTKEFELDALIKSLIDFPPRSSDTEASRDETKSALKRRIGEITEVVNALRGRISELEGDSTNQGAH